MAHRDELDETLDGLEVTPSARQRWWDIDEADRHLISAALLRRSEEYDGIVNRQEVIEGHVITFEAGPDWHIRVVGVD